MVLAAGAGRRLRPYTDTLPKTLVPVDGDVTILDIALRNFAQVDLRDVVVVVGYAADAVEERRADLERRYGVRLELVHNDKAEVWNNAYSLWCAREHLGDGALLVNGDTVHPVAVEETLLSATSDGIVLALDTHKSLADEEMKVQLDADGSLRRITKQMDPGTADGEYIGATLIGPGAGPGDPCRSGRRAARRRHRRARQAARARHEPAARQHLPHRLVWMLPRRIGATRRRHRALGRLPGGQRRLRDRARFHRRARRCARGQAVVLSPRSRARAGAARARAHPRTTDCA